MCTNLMFFFIMLTILKCPSLFVCLFDVKSLDKARQLLLGIITDS